MTGRSMFRSLTTTRVGTASTSGPGLALPLGYDRSLRPDPTDTEPLGAVACAEVVGLLWPNEPPRPVRSGAATPAGVHDQRAIATTAAAPTDTRLRAAARRLDATPVDPIPVQIIS